MSEGTLNGLEALGGKLDQLLELTGELKREKSRLEEELERTRQDLQSQEARVVELESARQGESALQTELDEKLGALQSKVEAFLNGG